MGREPLPRTTSHTQKTTRQPNRIERSDGKKKRSREKLSLSKKSKKAPSRKRILFSLEFLHRQKENSK